LALSRWVLSPTANQPGVSALPDSHLAVPLPSGTVTFVFTDIEGSTKRWDHEPLSFALTLGGDLTRAAILGGFADAASAQGCVRVFPETTTHDRLMALLGERLRPGELARRLAEGVALALEEL
jgi:hypothetical protein